MIDVWDGSMLWGSDRWVKENRPQLMHTAGEEQWTRRIKDMAEAGIELRGGLLMPFPSAESQEFTSVNRAVAAATAVDGPASIANPVYAVRPGDRANRDLLHELAQISPPVGIKLWPYMGGFNLDDVLNDGGVMDLLSSRNMLVLMHVGNGRERMTRPAFPDVRASPEVALKCARALESVPVVIGHVARLCPATLDQVANTPNAYLDLSGLTSLGRWTEGGTDGLPVDAGRELGACGPVAILRNLVDRYGLGERIIFGTTWPFCRWWDVDLADDVAAVRAASLPQATEAAIFGGTLKRLLSEVGREW